MSTQAYSVAQDESTGWKKLYHTDDAKGPQASDSKQHVVHSIVVGTNAERDGAPGATLAYNIALTYSLVYLLYLSRAWASVPTAELYTWWIQSMPIPDCVSIVAT